MNMNLRFRPVFRHALLLGLSLFFMRPGLLLAGKRTEAPLQHPFVSHGDWWQSQFGTSRQAWVEALSPNFQNRNSGPACVLMLVNYKKRSRISADFASFADPRYPLIHADVRWSFCRANADKGYPGGFAGDDRTEATEQELADVLEHESIPVSISSGPGDATIDRIIEAIGRYSLVICRIDPSVYFPDEKAADGRWVVVYGYDEASIFINDPGRPEGRGKEVPRREFLSSLRKADGGRDVRLLECLTMIGNYPEGWHADGSSRIFVDHYLEYRDELGFPYDNGGSCCVHTVGTCVVQDFLKPPAQLKTPNEGKRLLMLNRAKMDIFEVKGPFYAKYFLIWGFDKLGTAMGNEMPTATGRRQDFEKGSLIWNGKDVLFMAAPTKK